MSGGNRSPQEVESGEPGEARRLELELRLIADVGLVGFPNAGKSSLLRRLSRAEPKVGDYPFTTLRPVIGVVPSDKIFSTTARGEAGWLGEDQLLVADIPGLVRGAHMNYGLGHGFLRHVERAGILVYVVDTAAEGADAPWHQLDALRDELELYEEGLSGRAKLVVANKVDLLAGRANLGRLRQHAAAMPPALPVVAVSALLGDNVAAVVTAMRGLGHVEG